MAPSPISISIYNNDGSIVLLDRRIVTPTHSFYIKSDGFYYGEECIYAYEGSKKFIGLSSTPNSTEPDFGYAVNDKLFGPGLEGTFGSDIIFYIVEEEIIPPIDVFYRCIGGGNGKSSGQYVWSKHETGNGKILEYVVGGTESDYPDGGWSDGFWYKLKLAITPYLSFIGNEDFTLKTANTTKNWDGTLEYSTDTITWNTWNGTEISSVGSKLYLRGTGNTRITGNKSSYRFVFTGTNALKVACEGNIENLLDYETVSAGGHPTMANYCYSYMFQGCTALTTAPALPATTLSDYCYQSMFRGCTALTSAPALPATTLAKYCYQSMFRDCTALTTAPELPATTLASSCYSGMFDGCRKIKLSTTKTGEYQTAYRIPKSGTGTTATSALEYMFANTGGTFTGTPEINTTYYLSTSNTVV